MLPQIMYLIAHWSLLYLVNRKSKKVYQTRTTCSTFSQILVTDNWANASINLKLGYATYVMLYVEDSLRSVELIFVIWLYCSDTVSSFAVDDLAGSVRNPVRELLRRYLPHDNHKFVIHPVIMILSGSTLPDGRSTENKDDLLLV